MSNGEVKRFRFSGEELEPCEDGNWIEADIHDSIVAELKAEVLQYHRMAASGVWIESKAYNRQIETIAKQEKVIEKLKEELIDVYEGHRFDVDEMLERVAAIERGEA